MKQPISESLCQCGTSGEYNIAIKRLSEVHVGSVYRLDDNLVHARVLQTNDLGVEEYLWCSEAFRSDLDCQLVSDASRHLHSPLSSGHQVVRSRRSCLLIWTSLTSPSPPWPDRVPRILLPL